MKRLLLLISALATCCAASPTTASATNFGFAHANSYDFNNVFGRGQDANFTNFVFHRASYERFFVSWDAYGAWNGSQCVYPTSRDSSANQGIDQLLAAITYTEQTLGQTPVVAITPDAGHSGASYAGMPAPPRNPTTDPRQYYCGIYNIEAALTFVGLLNASHPIYFEAYNEPDVNGVTAAQAAIFYAWGAIATGNWQGGRIIAGTFANPTNATYIGQYINDVKADWTGSVPSWSVHDYTDLNNFDGNGDALAQFISILKAHTEPTSDIWVTETSLNSRLDGGGSDCTAQTEGADTFRLIYAHNLVAHLFTYSWGAGGDYLGNNPAQVPCWYQDLYSNGF